MIFQANIRKWGNSLGIRLKKDIAEQLQLENGSKVELAVKGGNLVISPVRDDYSLTELVGRITPENCHAEFDTGPPAGDEAW